MSNLPVQSRLKAPSSRIGKPSSVKVNDVVPRSGIKPPSTSSSNETPQKSNLKQLKPRSGDINEKKSSSSPSPPSLSATAATTPRITKPSQSKITTKTTPAIGKRENVVSKKQSGSLSSLNKDAEAPVFAREKTQESIKDAETGILFKIGDRVLVSGTKAGVIEYLGETKFAKGFWAGIKLDEATGKNNGSVSGVQYFECQPLHGVFSKVNRLHKINIVRDKKPSVSDFKLDDNSLLKIGDSVIVSGTKMGVLRYLGPTEFAKGEWAGVELKEPLGKNDGAVAGTRYFTCEPNYGLFAPSSKVTKSKKSVVSKTSNVVTPVETSLENAAKSVFNKKTEISEISDIPSSPNNEKLTSPEANKLTSPQTVKKAQTTSLQVAALQSALEEREREIHKMLAEREKSGRITENESNKENNSGHFEMIIKEKDGTIQTLKNELQKLKAENSTILASLEEERKKYEDLQFMLEEEKITDAELKDHVEQDEGKIRELSEETKEKNKKITNLQRDLQEARADNIRNEAKILEMKDEIQRLHSSTGNILNDNEDVVKLNKELNEIKEELRKKNEQMNDVEMKMNGQMNHINEQSNLSEKLARIEVEKENAVKECEKMKTEKGETSRELLQLKNEKNEVEIKHKSTVEKLEFIEKQHEDLLKTNSVLVAKKEEAIKANNLSLNATILDLEDQVGKLKTRISVLEKDMETVTAEYETKLQHSEKLLTETKRQLDEQIEENNKKNEIVNEMEEKLRMHIARQKEIEHEVEHLDKADRSLALMKEAHGSEVDALQSKIATLTETIDSLKKKQETINIDHKNDLAQQERSKNDAVNKLKEKIAQLESEKTVVLEECSRLKQDKEKLSNDLSRQRGENEEIKESYNTTFGELEALQKKCEELSQANEALAIERNDAIQLCEDQDQQLDVIKNEKEKASLDRDRLSKEKDGLSSKIVSLQEEIKTLNSKCDVKQVEIEEAKESEIRILKDKLDEVMRQKETSVDSVSSLKGQTQCLEKDIESKVVEINKLKTEQETLITQSMELENQVNELKKVLIEENESARNRVKGLETEISVLKDDVEEAQHLIKVKNEDIQGYKEQIEKLRGESIPKSPMDGDILENASTLLIRLHEAESKLSVLQSEKETAEEQVEFLNSVIVDLQNKNEKAKQTIALLEAGDDPIMLHGLDSDSDDEVNSKPKFAMRKFCDICDVFDEHDTDDCPLQSTGLDHTGGGGDSGGTQHHGNRSEERPYCGICEAFGHWSEDCDDEQTF